LTLSENICWPSENNLVLQKQLTDRSISIRIKRRKIMRAFLAIPIPEEIKEYAIKIKNKLDSEQPDIKWVEYANYHLTVKFLGEINNDVMGEIKDKMKIVGGNCTPFKLSINGVGFFPNKFRPRVVWLGINGELDKAAFLAKQVDDYLIPVGFEPEKNHRFHLTLGRIRSERNLNKIMDKLVRIPNKSIIFDVNEFDLMVSKLMPTGPSYTIIDKFTING
jgi:2'-5' RNA ligase